MASLRLIKQETIVTGADEFIGPGVNTAPWGGSPTNPAAKLFEIVDGVETDVTAALFFKATPDIVGDNLACEGLTTFTAGQRFRWTIQWDSPSGETWKAFGYWIID